MSSNYKNIVQALALIVIAILAITTWNIYSDNLELKSELGAEQRKIESLESSIRSQQNQIEAMNVSITSQQTDKRINDVEWYLRIIFSQFDSNVTPPVSKIEAVTKALLKDGWNSSTLSGMEVRAQLDYVKFFSSNIGGQSGFERIGVVTQSVNDYSPKFEYNVTYPVYPPVVGTVTYRYIWSIVVDRASGMLSIPPPGSYLVDAYTGELFKYDGLGFTKLS
jgi:hypothetical protein